jgi:uncharacterized protein
LPLDRYPGRGGSVFVLRDGEPVGVVILGATARAAAWSALRAGLSPCTVDLFADRDLKAVARSVAVCAKSFPVGLVDAAEGLPDGPWMYTGPLENHTNLVGRLSHRRTLWGVDAAALARVRDPLEVARVLRSAGHAIPDVRLGDPSGLPRDGSWLCKPIASAGGIGVLRYLGQETDAPASDYYQQHVAGESLSAVFVGTNSGASLAGVTRQLLGHADSRYLYAGSIGPCPLPPLVMTRIRLLGEAIGSRFGVVGLFGIDLILDAEGTPWLVEINPRYTASVEVLELAQQVSLLDAHRRACTGEPLPRLRPERPAQFVAKAIVYASEDGVFDRELPLPAWGPSDPWRIPPFADLPERGTSLRAGDPVLTLLVSASSLETCAEKLEEQRAIVGNVSRGKAIV